MTRSLNVEERFAARLKLSELPRNSSAARIRNRCEVSGRPRAFTASMKMSRIALRELGSQGPDPRPCRSRAGRRADHGSERSVRRYAHPHPQRADAPQGQGVRRRVRGFARTCSTCCKAEGYIRGYSTIEYGNGRTEFEIELKYFDGVPVIREIQRVSKPGRRVYAAVEAMPRVDNGLGITIVSTPKGVMADHAAREANVGGEILCKVF